MSTGWKKAINSVRTLAGNSLGGLKGPSNIASWLVAGSLAYYLWVRPSQQLKKEQEERIRLAAASNAYGYVENRKPESELAYGSKTGAEKSD